MKKHLKITVSLLTVGVLAVCMTFPAFAGWEGSYPWTWVNEDGSQPVNGWQWIDSNGDGTAACFYFDADGNVVANIVTPDGYTVDADGRWTLNEVIQQKVIGEATHGLPYEGTYYYLSINPFDSSSYIDQNSKITVTKNADNTYHIVGSDALGNTYLNDNYSIFADAVYGSELRSSVNEYGYSTTLYYQLNPITGKYQIVQPYNDGIDYFEKQ